MTPKPIKTESPVSAPVEENTYDVSNALPGKGACPEPPGYFAARSKWNGLIVLVMFFILIVGCDDGQKARENAAIRGDAAGRKAGREAGKAEGYKETYGDAKAAAFNGTVKELYQKGEFKRQRTYFIIALVSAFILGFGFQFGLLYLLRKKEVFFDIDRIVLGKEYTSVDFKDLSHESGGSLSPALKKIEGRPRPRRRLNK